MTNMNAVAAALRSSQFKGVPFWDLTSLTSQPELWSTLINSLAAKYRNLEIDMIVGLDARGFFFAGALGHVLGVGVVPVRKQGKLPGETVSVAYGKEYEGDGEDKRDIFELQRQYITPGMRVLIVDDVLATGGSAEAACQLVELCGGEVVGLAFGIEIPTLGGRITLLDYAITSEISILADGKAYGNVRYCVDMIGAEANGSLVLIERLKDGNLLAIPGGKIDPGLTVRQTAEKEYPEETGYSCSFLACQEMLATPHRDLRDDEHKVSIVVTVEITGGKRRGENGKTRVVPWDTTQGLPGKERFAFDHGTFLHGWWQTNGQAFKAA